MDENPGDDQSLRDVAQTYLLEAELTALTDRLSQSSLLSQHLALFEQDPASYWQQVMQRRTALATRLRATRGSGPSVREPSVLSATVARQSLIASILDLLYPWQKLPVPFMEEGIAQDPGLPGTSGGIDTAALDVGIVGFEGRAEDDGTQRPLDPKFWIHNWRCVIPFLPAPGEGWLSWRCGVSTETHIYDESLLSGSLTEFVTVGTTKDTYQPITNWATAGWPVNATLPSDSLDFYGNVPVTGSLLLGQGERAALGLIVGVIVSVASGLIEFFWGNLAVHLVLPPDTPGTPSDYGLIEYRFIPRPVFEAVQAVVSSARAS